MALLGIMTLHSGMILFTLIISSHGFALDFPKGMILFTLSISFHGFALGFPKGLIPMGRVFFDDHFLN